MVGVRGGQVRGRRRHDLGPRERVLRAAGELFYAEGIGAVGVDRLRDVADVAKSTIYEHFGSKDGVVAEYLAVRSAQWRSHLEVVLAAADPAPRAQIAAIFAALGRWFAEPGFRGCPFINAAAELPDPDHPANPVAAAHRAWVLDLLTRLARDAGCVDPPRLGRQLALLYDASMSTAQATGDAGAAADAAAAADTLVVAALPGRSA